MRFIHIADVHIGMKPDNGFRWSDERATEIMTSLDRVVAKCNKENVDLLLIAGDLFHRQPLRRELKEVNYIFSKLSNTKVVIMAGNHDYVAVTSKYKSFEWNENVSMFLEKDVTSIYLKDINTEIYGFSYTERDVKEHRYEEIKPNNKQRINILLAHGGDIKDIPIDFTKIKETEFDYVALGHIHKPSVIYNNVAYAGSLEPLDKTELGEHGYIFGELEKEKCDIRFVPFSKRRYVQSSIEISPMTTNNELLDKIDEIILENGRDNIYIIKVEGIRNPDIEFNIQNVLKEYNIISLEDLTLPDYDFKILYEQNSNNILGMFINEINNMDIEEDIKKKTLYMGVEVLTKKS